MRRVLAVLLVGGWLGLLGALAARQSTRSTDLAPALPAGEIAERDEWFTVHREGERIGHAHRTLTATDGGYRLAEELVVALTMLGTPQTLQTTLVADTDAAFALSAFQFALVSPAAAFAARGRRDADAFTVTYGQSGTEDTVRLPVSAPIYLPSTLRPRVLAGPLAPGTRYSVPVFNPVTLRNEPLTVTVEGPETLAGPDGPVDAVRLVETHQGLEARVWLARDGSGSVREEGSLGFTLERAPRARALASVGDLRPVDVVAATRIPLEGRIADPRATERLVLRVSGPAVDHIPSDPPRQRLTADLLEIAREAPPATLALPLAPGADLAESLAPGPFIEAGDPAIVATARRVVGGETDAVAAARLLVAWVYDHVEKAPSVTVPSARAVLVAARGDCNEHAVLLAALARAAGIPARVVAGALYVDDGFYYHAWNELWLGAWVSADATLAQLPADATHVKLLDGGPERHGALAGVVGRLAFRTEEVRP